MSEWAESCITEGGCRALVQKGYMPEKPLIGWRPAFGDAVPKPRTGEAVVFAPFFERGFSAPTHPFFRRLLGYYGLQLHHLNPNGILHISIFITLCEAYLAIEPHLGLWKWLYCVKPVSKQDPNKTFACACAVGRASIQLRPKVPYVSISLQTPRKGWQSMWFYCRNEKPSLPDFVAGHWPVKLRSWSDPASADEMAEVGKIIPHLNRLIRDRLDAAHLITTFLHRRIQPIKKRCHPMSEYTGCSDPTRERQVKLTRDDIFSRVAELVSTDTNICIDGKPQPCHHDLRPKNDLSKYLFVTLKEDEEGVVDMPQATDAVTIVSHPPLKKLRTLGAGSCRESVQHKSNEVVARSCSELARQREYWNGVTIAQLPPGDEDTETMFHWKKRKYAEALTCSIPDPGLQNLSSLGRVAIYERKKKLSNDAMVPCLLPHSSASLAKEVSSSASREAAGVTVPHREETPPQAASPSPHREEISPHAASPSPTPQSEPRPQSPPAHHASPPTTLSTSIVPESIEMTHTPGQPLPCDNLGSSQQSVYLTMDSVEVEGEVHVHGEKAEKEPGMLPIQTKDAESKLLWEIDDEERVMVDWEKVKEAEASFETRLAEITLRFKRASELVVKLKQVNKELEAKLKQKNKDLEVKLKHENKVARAFEKKAIDLSKELDIVRAEFQDAKKKAAVFDAIRAACDKLSIDNPILDGAAVVTERLSSFPSELTDETAATADGGHCCIGMQLALATRG